MLRSAVLSPDEPLLPRWLDQLYWRMRKREIVVSQDLYQQWAGALKERGPDQGLLALETYRRAGLPAYQQTLRVLSTAPLCQTLRQHIREALLACN